MKTKLLILSLFLISSGLMAQRAVWQPGGDVNGVGDWADPANWDTSIPGSEPGGRAIFRGGECYVDSDVSTEALGLTGDYNLELGDNQDDRVAKLIIEDGGYVAALRNSRSEIGIWSNAILTVKDGGAITFGDHETLIASSKDRDGNNAAGTEVHLDGGTMTVNGIFGIDFFNDKAESGGTLFLNGGTLVLNDETGWRSYINPDDPEENMSIGKNGKIEYTSGLMQIAGDHKASLEAYEGIGRITGDFQIWLDSIVTETETTYVTKLSNEGGPGGDLTTDATLSDLTLSEGTLDPAFNAATYDYTAELPAGTTATPTVTANTANANATVDVTDATDVTSEDAADRTTTIVVTAEDGVTELTYSIVFTVSTTGIHDLSFDNFIYPNPASSTLYISHAEKIERVEIYSITGSRVLTQNNMNTEAIDISDLNAGLYFISVIDVNSKNIVRKFQKQ